MSIESLLRKKAEQQKQIEAEKPKLEIVPPPETGSPSLTGLSGLPSSPTSLPVEKHSVSPERDYTKTPNSVTRIVLAQGLFKGKSKQIYDYLWSISRGAIKPVRTFRKTHREIKQGAGIGSKNTVVDGLRHLEQIGLIKIISSVGVISGNEYEIFTPDEIGYTGSPSLPSSPTLPSQDRFTQSTRINQKLDNPVKPLSGLSGLTQVEENKGIYSDAKTSLKTNTKNDDEPFGKMIETFRKMGKGKPENWRKLAELLEMEFEIAKARTDSVSDAPAFLTAHLERRLAPKKQAKPKSLQVGKDAPAEVESFEAEPLTAEGRESTLKSFIGYMEKGQREFLMGLEDTYTREDWEWLMKELEAK